MGAQSTVFRIGNLRTVTVRPFTGRPYRYVFRYVRMLRFIFLELRPVAVLRAVKPYRCIDTTRTFEQRAIDIGFFEIRTGQIRATQVGTGQVGAEQIGTLQVYILQVRKAQ